MKYFVLIASIFLSTNSQAQVVSTMFNKLVSTFKEVKTAVVKSENSNGTVPVSDELLMQMDEKVRDYKLFYDDDTSRIKKQIAELEKQSDQLSNKYESHTRAVTKNCSWAISSEQWTNCIVDGEAKFAADKKDAETLVELHQKKEKVSADLNKLKEQLSGEEAIFNKMVADRDKVQKQVAENNAKTKLAYDAAKNAIQLGYTRLYMDFNSLGNDLLSVDQKLNAAEQALDKAVVGAYVKDKMLKLLNSNSLCNAVQECPQIKARTACESKQEKACVKTKEKTVQREVISGANMMDIFPYSQTSRSDNSLKQKSTK